MFCQKCGAEIPDESKFCPLCGRPVAQEPPVPTGDPPEATPPETTPLEAAPQEATSSEAPMDGGEQEWTDTPLWSGDSAAQTGASAPAAPDAQPSGDPPAATWGENGAAAVRAKPKIGPFVAILVAAVLAVGLLVGLVVMWLGGFFSAATGPVAKIAAAGQKTTSAGNFTVDFSFRIAEPDTTVRAKGTANVLIREEERDVLMYADMEVNNMPAKFAIYQGYFLMEVDSMVVGEDIQELLDLYFEERENPADYESLEAYTKAYLEEIGEEESFEKIEDVLDFDAMESCIRTYWKNLNSEKWLREYLGYRNYTEKGIEMYVFRPAFSELFRESARIFKPAFRHNSDYEELMDGLDDLEELDDVLELKLTFGVSSGELVQVDMDMTAPEDSEYEGNAVRLSMEFSDIGSTRVDEDALEELLERYQRNDGWYGLW